MQAGERSVAQARCHRNSSSAVRKFSSVVGTGARRGWPICRLRRHFPEQNQQLRSGRTVRLPHSSQSDGGRGTCLRLRDQLPRGLPQHYERRYYRDWTHVDWRHSWTVRPTLQPANGRFLPFVTLKGGFIDFCLSPSLLPLGTVESTL